MILANDVTTVTCLALYSSLTDQSVIVYCIIWAIDRVCHKKQTARNLRYHGSVRGRGRGRARAHAHTHTQLQAFMLNPSIPLRLVQLPRNL